MNPEVDQSSYWRCHDGTLIPRATDHPTACICNGKGWVERFSVIPVVFGNASGPRFPMTERVACALSPSQLVHALHLGDYA